MKGSPRYKCKECGCNFTKATERGYSKELKLKVIEYYLEGCGFRRIGRLLGSYCLPLCKRG